MWRQHPPIRPSWTLAPVTGVWLPERIQGWLRPPSRSDKLEQDQHQKAQDKWHDELATEIQRIYQSAAGGVLVLMTSYSSIQHVARRLSKVIDGLVQSDNRVTLAVQRKRFLDIADQGRKPLWLALGGAWTGLDINGKALGLSPEEDNLLTDLVIAKLPFNLNMSLTHTNRIETRPSVPWELLETTLRTKQGIGRLVRREGLPHNRRICVLDGRFNDQRFENFLSPIRRLFSIYPVFSYLKNTSV